MSVVLVFIFFEDPLGAFPGSVVAVKSVKAEMLTLTNVCLLNVFSFFTAFVVFVSFILFVFPILTN